MNERQLNYFLIAAEEKNLGRAAERLPLSLSALSRQIQSLEAELGTALFTRTVLGLELTKAGETLRQHALTLRTQFELTRNDVQRTGSEQIFGPLDVGVFGSATLNFIPKILKLFTTSHPEVELILHTAPVTQQFEYLHQGRTLICFDRLFKAPSELAVELVCKDSTVVALHASHRLAKKNSIDFTDLRDEPMISKRDQKDMPPEFLALWTRYGFEPRTVLKVQDMVTALSLVGNNLGIAFLPASLESLSTPNVVYRPLIVDIDLSYDLYCYYLKNERRPVLEAMLKTIREYRAANL